MYKAALTKEIYESFIEMQELTTQVGYWMIVFDKATHDEEILNRVKLLRNQWMIAAKRYKKASREFYIMYSVPMLCHYIQFNIPSLLTRFTN